ncbi:helix-turn-helix domain-containing protein [Streptomyces sp. NPDC101132]|uniref:helix-turn-helix domain-containing protein n=1 Tax=Streptomyces sp. NPDC101132 TaxID=3366110 RepID=UPI00380F3A55
MGGTERAGETEEFARLMRELKERSGLSYGALARKLHTSTSTLHRYCNGEAVPAEFAAVDRFARACGARQGEALDLHRAWLLADARRRAAQRAESVSGRAGAGAAGGSVGADGSAAARTAGRASGAPTVPYDPAAPGASDEPPASPSTAAHSAASPGPTSSAAPADRAGSVGPATSAASAGPAASAGSVGSAVSAGSAGSAGSAVSAGSATSAGSAGSAVSASSAGAESPGAAGGSDAFGGSAGPSGTAPGAAEAGEPGGGREGAVAAGARGGAELPGTFGIRPGAADGRDGEAGGPAGGSGGPAAPAPWYRRRRAVGAAAAGAAAGIAAVVALAATLPDGSGGAAGRPAGNTYGAVAGGGAGTATGPAASPSPSAAASTAAPGATGTPGASASPTAAPSSPAPKTPPTRAPAADPLAVSVRSHVWANGCDHAYLSARGPAEMAPPPVEQDAAGWAAAQRAVHAKDQIVEVTLAGRGAEPVVLQAVHVRVAHRRAPLAWNVYTMSQGCGGALTPAHFAVNLDAPRPLARPVSGHDGEHEVPAPVLPLRVSGDDPAVLRVEAATSGCDCDWYLELRWSSGGRSGTTRVGADGGPFRTSAANSRPTYGFASELGRWSRG